MEITFKSQSLEDTFNSDKELQRKHGQLSKKIKTRMAVLRGAPNLGKVPITKPEKRHKLTNNRKNQWAVDLDGNNRLIFEPVTDKDISKITVDEITAIKILEVTDYH